MGVKFTEFLYRQYWHSLVYKHYYISVAIILTKLQVFKQSNKKCLSLYEIQDRKLSQKLDDDD